MTSVTFNGVCKQYPDGTLAVDHLDLEIRDGEFVVFVGPSGCGKTTSLRMVAGLEEVTGGELMIDTQVANNLGPRERDVAMVFQNYALYPHLTTYQNLAFPLQSRGWDKKEIDVRVQRAAALLGLEEHLKRRPKSLSGGQRQRVAMGRAIVREPRVFLMDEPLSNLDAQLRVQMRAELLRLQNELRVTTIYVTHDQVEAMTMGDRIAVMRKGQLQQYGTPEELYDRPANIFVASFVGSPSMNLMRAEVTSQDGDVSVKVGQRSVVMPDEVHAQWPSLRQYDGHSVVLGVRPEDAKECADDADAYGIVISGNVRLVETLGHERLVHMTTEAEPVYSDAIMEIARDVDVSVEQSLARSNDGQGGGATLTARFEGRSQAQEGAGQLVVCDPRTVQFFDLQTGVALERALTEAPAARDPSGVPG